MTDQPPPAPLPPAAMTRMASTTRADGAALFTSDLSVNEFALVKECGFTPVGLVMGTSMYHVGIQIQRWNQSQELSVLTQAMYSARELAMARMEAEADALSADGIVGVRLEMLSHAGGDGPRMLRVPRRPSVDAPGPVQHRPERRAPPVHPGAVRRPGAGDDP